VGHYKPGREPFEHVLAALGVDDPTTAVHTGDNRRTDVAGARGMGMTSVRYTGVFDDQTEYPEADLVVSSHIEMLDRLGL
jgi:FMN phosphatase YigB (HAD superfamily)